MTCPRWTLLSVELGSRTGEGGCTLSAHKPVVLFMGADPDPENVARSHAANRPIVIAHTNGVTIRTTPQTVEMKRRVVRVREPELIVLNCQRLNWAGRPRNKFQDRRLARDFISPAAIREGALLRLPCRPRRKESQAFRPAASSSICASHCNCSRSNTHWVTRRNSSGDRLSMAASISSTRPMPGVYHPASPDCYMLRPPCISFTNRQFTGELDTAASGLGGAEGKTGVPSEPPSTLPAPKPRGGLSL